MSRIKRDISLQKSIIIVDIFGYGINGAAVYDGRKILGAREKRMAMDWILHVKPGRVCARPGIEYYWKNINGDRNRKENRRRQGRRADLCGPR